MSELLDAAIEEIDRVLIGNKDRHTEEVYLKNAIRYIREYGSQPQLNENQQIVLSWLKIKHFDSYFKAAVSDLFFYVRHDDIEGFPNLNYRKLVEGYKQLSDKEFAQVLEVFSRWAQEREEG